MVSDYGVGGSSFFFPFANFGVRKKDDAAPTRPVRAVWARRISDNPFANPLNGKDQDGSLDKDRFWLTAIKFF